MKELSTNGRLGIFVQVLAWMAIIGLIIESSAILISYFVSCANPHAAKNLYNGLNLYDLRQSDFLIYSRTVYIMLVILIMKSSLCYLVIQTISKNTLKKNYEYEK